MNNIIKFHGEAFQNKCSLKKAYVEVNNKTYEVSQKTADKFIDCSNIKEYVESIEYFAFQVLIEETVSNDGWFEVK